MNKKITCLIISFLLIVLLSISAFAAYDKPNLVDDANLLTTEEYNAVLEKLNEVSNEFGVVVAVATVNDTNGMDIVAFADKYQEEHYSKEGSNEPIDGALLVLDMGGREWYITTYGEGVRAFTDYGLNQLNNALLPYLQDGNYKGAFELFADTAKEYFEAERNGNPIDYNYQQDHEKQPISPSGWVVRVLIAILGGFGLSFAVTGSMKKKMKTVVPVKDANNYIDPDQSVLSRSTDRYLYHNLVVVPLPKNDNNHGGSSTHFSSGGFSHGGGGGHF